MMCQVSKLYHAGCDHTIRYRLVNRCSEGFCPDTFSCRVNTNWIIAFRPVYNPRWCYDCHDERIGAIRDSHENDQNEIMEQADGEDWSDEGIERALDRSDEQEAKEIGSFNTALCEVQAREQRDYRERRRQEGAEWDSDAEEAAALNEESDSEDEARPNPETLENERRVPADILDYSSGDESDMEDPSRRFANRGYFSAGGRGERRVFDFDQ